MNISFTEGDPQLRGITALSDSPGVPTQITQECNFFFFFSEPQHLIQAEKFLTNATLQLFSRSLHASKPRDNKCGELLTVAPRYFLVALNKVCCCPAHSASARPIPTARLAHHLECPIAPHWLGKSKAR